MNENQQMLVAALEAHDYDEWYSALLHAALEETGDAATAVRAADATFEKQPVDPSAPSPDDAEALFAAPGRVALAQDDDRLSELADEVKRLARLVEKKPEPPPPPETKTDQVTEKLGDVLEKLTELLARPAPAPVVVETPPVKGNVVKTNEIIYDKTTGKPKKVITTEKIVEE